MIKNKLKINNSKTKFIIFRSPPLKQSLSDLSVSLGDMQVSPSSKVRDLGVVFAQSISISISIRHHNIGYHIYADDTQLYISFKCKDPLESLTKLNMCISDIRVWMIKSKLKINDSKTEFIIFRSPLLKQSLSDLSVSVGYMQVSPSSKVRDLGVVFDQYLTFHDHISGICKSTNFHLRGIGRIRNLLTFDATAQLIH